MRGWRRPFLGRLPSPQQQIKQDTSSTPVGKLKSTYHNDSKNHMLRSLQLLLVRFLMHATTNAHISLLQTIFLHAHPPTLARKATSKQAGKNDSEPDMAELRQCEGGVGRNYAGCPRPSNKLNKTRVLRPSVSLKVHIAYACSRNRCDAQGCFARYVQYCLITCSC